MGKFSDSNWQNFAQILETQPSGIERVSDGVHIKPRWTFANYCRQFEVIDRQRSTENIACRKNNQWQLAASVAKEKVQQTDSYQTANGGSLLDAAVEEMAVGDFFDAQSESTVINKRWSK